MSKITNTAAGIAAAAAVATGVAVYSTFEQNPETVRPFVDDVVPVTVEIPQVEVPSVAAVTVSAATAPAITVNSFREVTLEVLEAAEVPPVQSAPLDVPGVPDLTADLPALVRLRSALLQLMRDQRTVMYATIRADDPLWPRWVDIYRSPEYANYVAEYKSLEPGLRIINEVKCPADSSEFETLQARLDYYGKRGYNAVLVTFDTTENLARLCAAVDYIKSAGFRIVIAYAGREHLSEPVFRDPDVLRRWLATLDAKADALLLGWRRTSLHLFLPDKPFSNFLIRSAREGNPDLPFVGMAYFGETAKTMQGVTYDVPQNCAAVLVVGIGYPRASSKTALQKLFPEVASHPHLIGLVVGERPYYDTLHATGRSQEENDATKRRIELRLLRAGCASTMTYSGDGSDGQYGDKTKTENLCRWYGKE